MTGKKIETTNEQIIKIDLGFAILVAGKSTEPLIPEFYIGLEDHDGCYFQDIAVVGQNYHIDNGCDPTYKDNISVRVWADKDSEDYTHDFEIDPYNPFEPEYVKKYDLDTMFEDVKKQLETGENTTEHGEPQAFISLENGRSIEITLEKEGLSEEDFFYSGRLHCTEEEFDNNAFPSTMGILNQEGTENADINSVKDMIKALLLTDEYFPVKNTKEKE